MYYMIHQLMGIFGGRREAPSEEEQRLRSLLAERRALEIKHAMAYEASRLEALKSRGTPFFEQTQQPQSSKPLLRAVPVYRDDSATGYPFVPAISYEQDPFSGWPVTPDDLFTGADLDGWQLPLNAFPREMFPERPSTLRTQIAQDAIRLLSRSWYESLPMYSGPIGHLRNYTCGAGLAFDVVSAGKNPEFDALAKQIKAWLEQFAAYRCNRLYSRVWDSVLNLFRDGEDFLRIDPGREMPEIRTVDASTIRGPHNEITGPWAFGCLTKWPKDFEEVIAYHLWHPDNSHEDVSPNLLIHAKLDTVGANVKRGVPLAYKIRKQLPQLSRLLDCMAVGEAARQAIPYVQQYHQADAYAVKQSISSSIQTPLSFQQPSVGGDVRFGDTKIEPGQVQHINRGLEYQPPPQGYAGQGQEVFRAVCESIACALNVPLWMVIATADSETYASALVSEAPVVKLIEHYQEIVCTHYEKLLRNVVAIATARGMFPPEALTACEIHCHLPSPVARDRDKETNADLSLLEKGIMSPQEVASRAQLDFAEQRELIQQAEQEGWKKPEPAPNPNNPNQEPGNGNGNQEDSKE